MKKLLIMKTTTISIGNWHCCQLRVLEYVTYDILTQRPHCALKHMAWDLKIARTLHFWSDQSSYDLGGIRKGYWLRYFKICQYRADYFHFELRIFTLSVENQYNILSFYSQVKICQRVFVILFLKRLPYCIGP